MTTGLIPQSQALAEASPSSLAELMSRDPEGYSKQDRVRIVEALRADRARREAAEQASGQRPKVQRVSALTMASAAKPEDLDL